MLDTFASVGATHFDLTHTNIDGEKRGYRPSQSLAQIKNSMPRLFHGAAERQNPTSSCALPAIRSHFVQLDDLVTPSRTEQSKGGRFHDPRDQPRAIIRRWIAVSGASLPAQEAKDFARRLRKGTGADLTASGATRVAGTSNYKRKYEPEFSDYCH